jgi:transposase
MERVNEACNWISAFAFEQKVFKRFPLQKAAYHEVKARFSLTAQAAIHATRKVADAYGRDQKTRRTFRPHGSITYDDRILRYYEVGDSGSPEVSIWATGGRLRIGFVVGEHHARLLAYRQGESDLVYRKQTGEFFLLCVCDIPEDKEIDVEGVLGVDLGIKEIATTSEGESFSGEVVEQNRAWYAERKAVLQAVGSRSSKRRLRQLSGREKRFRAGQRSGTLSEPGTTAGVSTN